MKIKTIDHIIYKGLGFPIKLCRVKMMMIDNKWHPKVNVKKIADLTIKALASQKDRLTGNQIRFIRLYFSMTLREFASQVVNESHTAVSKWEKSGNEITSMDINIEKILRLYIYEKIAMKTIKQKEHFYKNYLELKQINLNTTHTSYVQIAA